VVQRAAQLLMLLNLLLLGFVSFVPLPTRLVAEHTAGADALTAMRLYGGTLAGGLTPGFLRDVNICYLLGLVFAAESEVREVIHEVADHAVAVARYFGRSSCKL
jgi:hypothetical protein